MISYPHLSTTGRLGNQLWEIASTFGIAASHGTEPRFPKWDYQPFFSCPEEWFVDDLTGMTDAITLVPHLDPRAAPYLQDYWLFEHVQDQVRKFFKPSELAQQTLVGRWLEQFEEIRGGKLSVHVRRGDNVTHPQGYHPLRSMEYYRQALQLHPGNSACVFSDDIEWCKENFTKLTGRKVYAFYEGKARAREYCDRVAYETEPFTDWIDLFLMSFCNKHILSNSTYAWWGAFLSDDPEPIYPSNWFGREVSPWTDSRRMFPPSWRQVHDATEGGV